ncbi:hypothetical protein D3C84_927000 [compost metagenome]
MWQLIDEGHVIGQPPARHLVIEIIQQLFAARALSRLEHHNQQRALLPLRMGNTDHCGFSYSRVTNRDVFQIDRGYPFAAGLDHIFGAIGDLHVAIRVDGGDVAGIEPAILIQDRAALATEIAVGDPGPFDQQMTEGLAIAWQAVPFIVRDLH